MNAFNLSKKNKWKSQFIKKKNRKGRSRYSRGNGRRYRDRKLNQIKGNSLDPYSAKWNRIKRMQDTYTYNQYIEGIEEIDDTLSSYPEMLNYIIDHKNISKLIDNGFYGIISNEVKHIILKYSFLQNYLSQLISIKNSVAKTDEIEVNCLLKEHWLNKLQTMESKNCSIDFVYTKTIEPWNHNEEFFLEKHISQQQYQYECNYDKILDYHSLLVNMLLFGYVRQQNISIPMEIHHLCFTFILYINHLFPYNFNLNTNNNIDHYYHFQQNKVIQCSSLLCDAIEWFKQCKCFRQPHYECFVHPNTTEIYLCASLKPKQVSLKSIKTYFYKDILPILSIKIIRNHVQSQTLSQSPRKNIYDEYRKTNPNSAPWYRCTRRKTLETQQPMIRRKKKVCGRAQERKAYRKRFVSEQINITPNVQPKCQKFDIVI